MLHYYLLQNNVFRRVEEFTISCGELQCIVVDIMGYFGILKINNYLQTLRDYFLLGNGGFWQCIDIPVLETIPVTVTNRGLNFGPLKSAVEKYNITHTHTNQIFEKISFKFSLQKFTTRDNIITFKSCTKIIRTMDVLLQF